MKPKVLGLSCYYHDSAAALVSGDHIVAAAEEERFSRIKHDSRFPFRAINYCLEEAFIEPKELDAVAYYDHPLLTWGRLSDQFEAGGEKSKKLVEKASESIIGVKFQVSDHIRSFLGSVGKVDKLLFCPHHLSHAASAFYPSPFGEAAVLIVDGVGEYATTSLGYGKGNQLELLEEINFPHSIGLLYSAFTFYCGFKVNSGEYKLMGLAPYGKPKYAEKIFKHLIDLKPDGSFRVNPEYFNYPFSTETLNPKFERLFGRPPRDANDKISQFDADIASSIQAVTEEVMLRLARYARKKTGSSNLVMAGGVALNCVANGKISNSKIFKKIWVQPASGDSGGALGAALLASHQYFETPRKKQNKKSDTQQGSYLGPAYSRNEVVAFLDRYQYPHREMRNRQQRAKFIASEVSKGKVVGFFNGRMEFGPRALGGRSFLGDPRNPKTQSRMNLQIKQRESFRPFAPIVLKEDCKKYFDLIGDSPYMLMVAPVKKSRREKVTSLNGDDLIQKVNQVRSDIPAVTHVDFSARIQTVTTDSNPNLYSVLSEFKKKTGCSVLVNTSFNVRGEPIVCSPSDAYDCFMRTDADILVLEDFILLKTEQPKYQSSYEAQED